MKVKTNLFKLVLVGLAVVLLTPKLYAQEIQDNKVNLYFFWGNGCPHCEEENKFLTKLEKENPSVTVNRYEVWGDAKNRDLFKQVGELLGTDVRGVPFTVVGDKHVTGYYNDATTGEQIKQYIDYCLTNTCTDVMELLYPAPAPTPKDDEPPISPSPTPQVTPNDDPATPIPPPADPAKNDPWRDAPISLPKEVTVPIVGKVNLTTLSLPIIAVILGTLDGFNPCAMWVLLFLISLLINLPDKNRRWLLGISFLLASGLVYFFFMAAWLNILLFVGFIAWVRIGIALFAIVAGSFSLNKYLKHKTGCEVTGTESRKKTFEKLKKYTYDKSLLTAMLGIVGLAFAVNLVELLCSAGFPAIFTQILALNNLAGLQYYLYIGLYILFFMLDDLLIFFIAMRTLEVTGISTKYSKYSNLIGGLLMLVIGLLLIFKPDILMFNF